MSPLRHVETNFCHHCGTVNLNVQPSFMPRFAIVSSLHRSFPCSFISCRSDGMPQWSSQSILIFFIIVSSPTLILNVAPSGVKMSIALLLEAFSSTLLPVSPSIMLIWSLLSTLEQTIDLVHSTRGNFHRP